MQAHDIDGKLIGTFEGKAGNQFGLIETKIELLLQEVEVNSETGEQTIKLAGRAHKPVDEIRFEINLPDYSWEKLQTEIEDLRE